MKVLIERTSGVFQIEECQSIEILEESSELSKTMELTLESNVIRPDFSDTAKQYMKGAA